MAGRMLVLAAVGALAGLAGCGGEEAVAPGPGRILVVVGGETARDVRSWFASVDPATGSCRRIRSLAATGRFEPAPFPKLSPTGAHLAQIVPRRGGAELRVTTVATGRTRVVPLARPYPDVEWSADGRRLAYRRGQGWEVAGADGSGQRTTIDGAPRGFAWSPDGTRVAFVSTTGDGRAGTLRTTLDVTRVDGTGRRTLYVEPNPAASQPSPVWSPDGATIAFGVLEPSRILSVPVSGGPVRRLGGGFEPLWSPDGDEIAFGGFGPRGATEVFVMRADGSGRRRLTTTRPGHGNRVLAWSPGGDAILYGADSALAIVNPDGSGRRELCRFSAGVPASAVWIR
jgi:Tol biopolymer transport system component